MDSLKGFVELLLITNSYMESEFSEVITALTLFLTLPVTVATAERSFSKLKIIKNYLRNTMTEDRLSELAVLAIDSRETKKSTLEK